MPSTIFPTGNASSARLESVITATLDAGIMSSVEKKALMVDSFAKFKVTIRVGHNNVGSNSL